MSLENLSKWNLKKQLIKSHILSRLFGVYYNSKFNNLKAYCFFLGTQRNGLTILSSLLNAHPNILLSHELSVFEYIKYGFTKEQIYTLILLRDKYFGKKRERKGSGYDYNVPGQWQGYYDNVRIIGDKQPGKSARFIDADPELLSQLKELTGLPVRVIQHVRNPYDNISTICRKKKEPIEKTIDRYFSRQKQALSVTKLLDTNELIVTRHEELIEDPEKCINKVLNFLDLPIDNNYILACTSKVFKEQKITRTSVNWTAESIEKVKKEIDKYPFLTGYSYEI